ncbi:MAG: spiro-SPASM protein [Spirochaetia bacterium]|nr:spiro-SPASM protein [Spirochaetia bacterium]
MEKTIILCHFNLSTLQLWESLTQESRVFREKNDILILLNNFINFINKLGVKVTLSYELENNIIKLIKQGLKNIQLELSYAHEISLLKHIFSDKNIESVYYIDSIYSIGDLMLTQKLFEIHNEYSADYSYIENAPPGLAGVFFNRSLFEAMQMEENELSDTSNIDKAIPDSIAIPLSEYIEKNINHFHVEIHYEHPDLRLLRLDFAGKTTRSIQSSNDVFNKCGENNDYYIELEDLYNKAPELLHHFPSYLELEIYGGCEYACTFCARQFIMNPDAHMLTLENITSITNFIQTGLNDTSIAIGGLGEPLEHPQIVDIINHLLTQKYIPMVVLETNGRHLEKIISTFDHSEIHKLRIVVNFNSMNNYQQMHGAKNGDKEIVIQNIEKCCGLLSKKNESYKKNIFIQTLKIQDNETELDELYDLSDKYGISFLLQKYNSYIGLMPEKRVSDMTPLERFFCWHLRRDLYIKSDGNVVFCKQDIQNLKTRGNINNNSMEDIWKTSLDDWKNNYNNVYPQCPDCKNCDEYYTFNM